MSAAGGEREASWVLSATPPPPTRRPKLSRRTQSTSFHPISACGHQMRSLEILQKSFEKSGRSLKVEKGEAKEEKEAGAGERSCRDAVSSPTNLLPKLPFGLNSRTSTYNHSTIKQELDKKTCSGPDVFVLCSSGHKKTSKVLPETYSYKKQTVSST